jgi:hypothetical protein
MASISRNAANVSGFPVHPSRRWLRGVTTLTMKHPDKRAVSTLMRQAA